MMCLCLLVVVMVTTGSHSVRTHVIQNLTVGQLAEKVEMLTEGMETVKETVKTLVKKIENIEERHSDGLTAESVTECPPSWIKFHSSCYGVGDASVTWGAAQEMCSEFGGWLVEVDSFTENGFVKSIGRSRGYEMMWLGATDAFSDGHWRWTNSGRLLREGFTDWLPGQQTANDGGNQDCLAMVSSSNYRWHDYGCNKALKFICEISA